MSRVCIGVGALCQVAVAAGGGERLYMGGFMSREYKYGEVHDARYV